MPLAWACVSGDSVLTSPVGERQSQTRKHSPDTRFNKQTPSLEKGRTAGRPRPLSFRGGGRKGEVRGVVVVSREVVGR
jgi:hypothetical protein